MLTTEEDAVTPSRDAHLVALVLVVVSAHLELVSGWKLDLRLFKFREYIPCLLLLKELVEFP